MACIMNLNIQFTAEKNNMTNFVINMIVIDQFRVIDFNATFQILVRRD